MGDMGMRNITTIVASSLHPFFERGSGAAELSIEADDPPSGVTEEDAHGRVEETEVDRDGIRQVGLEDEQTDDKKEQEERHTIAVHRAADHHLRFGSVRRSLEHWA
jgi:hypothetical protein